MSIDKKMSAIKEIAISPTLVAALKKVRKSFDEGGPAKPIDINDYLELGMKLMTLSQAERDAIAFMYKKMLEAEKK